MDNQIRAQGIKMILMDVDGTLTDGSILVLPDGEEVKAYHVRDGLGIIMAHLVGFKTGIITGKTSQALEIRAARLKIPELHQGILDKKRVLLQIMQKYDLAAAEIAFIGDDLGDLEPIKMAGLSAAVADAHPEIIKHSHFLCTLAGGKGAVREFIEFIFSAQDKWSILEKKVAALTQNDI